MAFGAIGTLILTYRYWILFPLACFEGPLFSIIIGFFISLGYFNPLLAYALLICGDIVPDSAYYFLGRFGSRGKLLQKYGGKLGIKDNHVELIQTLWREHPAKTMFTSKLAYGLSTPFLISAGISDMPFAKFLSYAVPVTLFQYAVLMTLGYFFGNSYQTIKHSAIAVELAIALIVIAGAGYYAFTVSMKKRVLQQEREAAKK